MEETKLTAALPNLDIQILHREIPEEGAEIITLSLKATPSFEAAAGAFLPLLAANPLLGAGAALPGGLPAGNPMALWMAPMQAWTGLMKQAWAPWLAMVNALPRPGAPR